jgi:hypothetical protein
MPAKPAGSSSGAHGAHGGATATLSLTKTKNLAASKFLIEEKNTKPPGQNRFSRHKHQIQGDDTSAKQTTENLTLSDFCQQTLVEGYVQSYIDFYYLTHRVDS